jgi:hypothetical protein
MRGKKALLFEKRSKNFCSLACPPTQKQALKKQKFFGSFLQKRTLSFCFLTHPPSPKTFESPAKRNYQVLRPRH